MNVYEHRDHVLSVYAEAQRLAGTIGSLPQPDLFINFITALSILVSFVSEDLNLKVLDNYRNKAAEVQDSCPLDILCKKILQKLTDMDSLLNDDIFAFLRADYKQVNMPFGIYNGSKAFGAAYNELSGQTFTNLLSAFNILKHLRGHNKTLIVLGPNGSGKTSFANHIKNADPHIKVIPASKPLKAVGNIPAIYSTTLINYNQEIYSGGILQENLLQKLIIGLCTEHDNAAREYYDTRIQREKTCYEKTKKIFDAFFEVKLDNSAFATKHMMAKKNGAAPFDFNSMSDGERAAFFYIATVVAAPEQSFIIVDEPENHLNPAIYNKIWDKLIAVRNDCQFIFISHTIDFINARSNYELVKIKNFVHPDKFEFEFLGSALENVPSAIIVDIVGSRKPILFCEGSKNEYDYKLYEKLFGNHYTVIPAGSCLSVKACVEACNMHASTYSIQSAIGIIDSDLKSPGEIESLKKQKVYALKCNEIEMLLLDELIFKKVLAHIYKSPSEFENFKSAFFTKLSDRKQHIVKRLVKTQIDEKLRSSIIDDKNNKTKDEIKTNLSHIFDSLDVDAIWDNCEAKIIDIINRKDYDSALQYCCLEHSEIIVGIGKQFVSDYATIALGVLGDDAQLSDSIKNKYFPEITKLQIF